MDNTKYTILHDGNGVRIAGYNSAVFTTNKLAEVLATLSTDHEPQGADEIIAHNAEHKWGQEIFRCGDLFIKGDYTYRHADRVAPFQGNGQLISNWEYCTEHNLPVPQYLGIWSVQQNDVWMWNGIVVKFLTDWRTLNKTDIQLMAEMIDAFADAGVFNRDMHSNNVMTDGNGNALVVDLDNLKFDQNPVEAKASMQEFYNKSLDWED